MPIPSATFQWLRNGVPLRGAMTATLRPNNVRPGDAGSYAVTATNGSGTGTSRAALLHVK